MSNTSDFEACDRCAQQTGGTPLCTACASNQATIHRLLHEHTALVEVYVLAARMRMFPVPFDQHFELVGSVDECRLVLEPPIDHYAPADADKTSRENFLRAFREVHTKLHQLWTAAVDQPGYDKKRWIALDNAIARFARDAGEAFGVDRSEALL